MASETMTDFVHWKCAIALLVVFLFLHVFPSSYLKLFLNCFILVFVCFFTLLQILFFRDTVTWTPFVEEDMLLGIIQ